VRSASSWTCTSSFWFFALDGTLGLSIRPNYEIIRLLTRRARLLPPRSRQKGNCALLLVEMEVVLEIKHPNVQLRTCPRIPP
jgi:hypothetical protein